MSVSTGTDAVMILSSDLDFVAAIERFDVPADDQEEAIQTVRAAIRDEWQGDPAFAAALILRGRQGGGLATYVQWRTSDTGTVPAAPPDARSLRRALHRFPVTDSRIFEVAFTRQAPSAPSPTRISLPATPCIHFGIFQVTPEHQPVMLARAEEEAPHSFGTPGLLAIDFHRSVDTRQVLNVGVWSSFDGFAALHDRPSFKPGEQYFQGIADFSAAFFDLVDVIAAP